MMYESSQETTPGPRSLDLSDPLASIAFDNPYQAYNEIRNVGGLWRSEAGYWITSTYDVIKDILRSARFGQDYESRVKSRLGDDILQNIAFETFSRQFAMADPPRHTRLRAIVADSFSAGAMARLHDFMAEIAETYMRRLSGIGELDLMREFAHPYPCEIACRLIGMPEEMLPYFLSETRASSRIVEPFPMSQDDIDEANRVYSVLWDTFREVIAYRRRHPSACWASKLLEDGSLEERDLIPQLTMLFSGGFDTMTDFIGNSICALLEQPERVEELCGDKGPMDYRAAVQELLRFDAPIQLVSRVALSSSDIAGQTIGQGEVVVLVLAGGNRDPARYPAPDLLDFSRINNAQLAFGGGIHTCLGAQMTKVEGQVVLTKLFGEHRRLDLNADYRPCWRQNLVRRGVRELRVSIRDAS